MSDELYLRALFILGAVIATFPLDCIQKRE